MLADIIRTGALFTGLAASSVGILGVISTQDMPTKRQGIITIAAGIASILCSGSNAFV